MTNETIGWILFGVVVVCEYNYNRRNFYNKRKNGLY